MLLVCSGESEKSINRVWAGQGKFIAQWHFRSKSETAQSFDTENRRIGKIHNVKSSRERQVKALRAYLRAGSVLLFMSCFISRVSCAEDVDVVFTNGNIYTVNERQPQAEAVAVRSGRIVFVGSNADTEKLKNNGTRIVDLQKHTVVPGLTDSHCHIFGIGEREMRLNLEGTNSLDDFLAKVKEHVAHAPHDKWITGRGWIETSWKPPQFPTGTDLDKITRNNPVLLTRADGIGP